MNPSCYNEQAEKSLCGAVLTGGNANFASASKIIPSSEAFYDVRLQTYWSLFTAMVLENVPIDISSVMAEAKRRNMTADMGPASFMGELIECSGLCDYHAGIVAECWLRRRVLSALVSGAESLRATGDTATLVDKALTAVFAAAKTTQRSTECWAHELMPGVLTRIEDALNGKTMTGLKTGIDGLDRLFGGLKPGAMVVVGARPSAGKTALGLQVAFNVALSGAPVGFFSCEMTKESIAERLLSLTSKVSMDSMLRGNLIESDLKKIQMGHLQSMKAKIVVDDEADLSSSQFQRRAMAMVEERKVKLIVIDYIQLMSGTGKNRYEEVTEISKAVKRVSKVVGVPILVLAQLSRKVEDEDRAPRSSDLRESGQLEQDADMIFMLHRLTQPDEDMTWLNHVHPDDPRDVNEPWQSWGRRIDLVVTKNRNGATGKVRLLMQNKTMRFEQLT